MKNEIPMLPIPSIAHFKGFYNLVGDGIFLYKPLEDKVVEGNLAFRSIIAADDGDLPDISLAQLFADTIPSLSAGAIIDAVLAPEGGLSYAIQLHVADATLDGQALFLCILKDRERLQASLQKLALAETEKKALLKEVYHRVKNNLNIIISLLGLQLSRVEDAKVRHVLTESKSRMFVLALLQERLYHSPRLSEVNANEYLACLAQSVIATFKRPKQQITFVSHTEECWLNVDTLVPLGLLIHELVANAVLHAFPEGFGGEISFSFHEPEPGFFQLMVQDSGRGIPEGTSFADYPTLGSKLIISLARQLKAELQLESALLKGTKITIRFSTLQQHGRV